MNDNMAAIELNCDSINCENHNPFLFVKLFGGVVRIASQDCVCILLDYEHPFDILVYVVFGLPESVADDSAHGVLALSLVRANHILLKLLVKPMDTVLLLFWKVWTHFGKAPVKLLHCVHRDCELSMPIGNLLRAIWGKVPLHIHKSLNPLRMRQQKGRDFRHALSCQ